MNTLLSFTPTLSQPELLAAVKEVGKLAEYDGPAAMEHIRALVRRYPTDTQLRFRLASIAMGFPQLYGWPDEAGEAAGDFAEQAFEYVCQHGKKKAVAQRHLPAGGVTAEPGQAGTGGSPGGYPAC